MTDEDLLTTFTVWRDKNLLSWVRTKASPALDPEDFAQDVFIRAWRARSSYREEGNKLTTWLWTIANNLLYDYYRERVNRHALHDESLETLPAHGDSIDALCGLIDAAAVVRTATPGVRASVLDDALGYTDVEAAARLGITPVLHRARLHRFRLKLRAEAAPPVTVEK